MIPVALADAPSNFDARVRQPGLDVIAELVGEPRSRSRSGRKRKALYASRESIPPDQFPPYWREVLPDMLVSYNRICAYLSLHIEHATGSPSVDHVVPKSKAWNKVYEWSNYRLACAWVNNKKNTLDLLIDPVGMRTDLFALELVEFQVVPGPAAAGTDRVRVEETIRRLGLSDREPCDARREYVESYTAGHIDLEYLERRAPFLARELRRQGKLSRGDR